MKKSLSLLFILVFCFSFSSCGGSDSGNQTPEHSTPLEASAGSKSAPDVASTQQIIGITDILSSENFEFNIQSVSAVPSLINDLGVEYKSGSGNTFLIAVITAKNISSETQNVMNTNFNASVDGTKITIQPIVGKINGSLPLLGAVSADEEFTGYTVWELPRDWETLNFSYIDALTGSESDSFIIESGDLS